MAGLPNVTAATSGVEPLFSQFKAVPAAPSVSLPLSSANLPFKENRDPRGAFLKIDFTTTRVGITLDACNMQISGIYPDLLNKVEAWVFACFHKLLIHSYAHEV